jgi:adenylate cyclase
MTPQGLVKVMNHYLSTMSGPIRSHRGIIDKYIGDAIMAYWGPSVYRGW